MSTAYINPSAHSHSPTVNVADREDAQRQLMDRGAPEYTQPGLHSPYSLALRDSQSERSPSADQASAAQFTNTPQQDVRPANFASSSTPTSDYSVNASSARSANFPPDYLARQQQYAHHPNNSSAGAGNMAQATSPSMSLQDGHQHNHHNAPHMKSDPDVPIDPSIAASSPTFPGHYSPYPPPGNDMAQYQGHPPPQMYGRPDWAPQYAQHAHGMPGPYSSPGTAVSSASSVATAGPRPGQVSLSPPFGKSPISSCHAVSSAVPGILLRSDPGCSAAQTTPSSLRRNREDVQMWVAWLRKGLRHAEPPERARHDAVTRCQTYSRR